MKMKKTICYCCGTLIAIILMAITFAQKTTENEIPISSLMESKEQTLSFYQQWGGSRAVTGKKWEKVYWNMNAGKEEDFEIYLEDDGGYPLYFNLQVNNVDHEFCLSSGETEHIQVEGGGSFSLFAQYGHHNESGIPSGTVSLGPLA